jgi:hypothetical protein
MGGLVKLIAQLLGILKSIIAPSEYEKWCKEFWKIKEENDAKKKRIAEALAAGDVGALNIILSDLLEL